MHVNSVDFRLGQVQTRPCEGVGTGEGKGGDKCPVKHDWLVTDCIPSHSQRMHHTFHPANTTHALPLRMPHSGVRISAGAEQAEEAGRSDQREPSTPAEELALLNGEAVAPAAPPPAPTPPAGPAGVCGMCPKGKYNPCPPGAGLVVAAGDLAHRRLDRRGGRRDPMRMAEPVTTARGVASSVQVQTAFVSSDKLVQTRVASESEPRLPAASASASAADLCSSLSSEVAACCVCNDDVRLTAAAAAAAAAAATHCAGRSAWPPPPSDVTVSLLTSLAQVCMAGLPASCGRCPFASGRGAKTCRSPCGPGEFEGRRNDACHKCPAGKYNPCRQGYGMVLSLAEDGVAAVNAAQEFKVGSDCGGWSCV
jgi:hypothetical protein